MSCNEGGAAGPRPGGFNPIGLSNELQRIEEDTRSPHPRFNSSGFQ